MALSETYVDPSIAANSGTGTIGDPYGDLQYALDTMTRDGTEGDRVNVKAGTDEVLSSAIDLTTYGAPAFSAPLILSGYTSIAGDGGKGGIDCGGSDFKQTQQQAFSIRDLVIHNVSNTATCAIRLYRGLIFRCEFHDIDTDAIHYHESKVVGCHIHDVSGIGCKALASLTSRLAGCYFKNDGTKDMTYCVSNGGLTSLHNLVITDNVMSIDGSTGGILAYYGNIITGNSILSSAGTASGIESSRGVSQGWIYNNLIEGFSGAGGIGLELDTSGHHELYAIVGANSFYNNTTDVSFGGEGAHYEDNESLSSSPFAKSGSDTYALRSTYFEPQDVAEVLTGLLHNEARGAIQPAGGAASMLRRSNMRGGY